MYSMTRTEMTEDVMFYVSFAFPHNLTNNGHTELFTDKEIKYSLLNILSPPGKNTEGFDLLF